MLGVVGSRQGHLSVISINFYGYYVVYFRLNFIELLPLTRHTYIYIQIRRRLLKAYRKYFKVMAIQEYLKRFNLK